MLDEAPSVGESKVHGFDKTGIVFPKTVENLMHRFVGIASLVRSDLCEVAFLLGIKMYLRAVGCRGWLLTRQRAVCPPRD